jgi:hypothetical protein
VKRNRVQLRRFLALGIVLLVLVTCKPSVEVGEYFTLWEGETVSVKGTGLTIEAEMVGFGIPGSHDPEDGFADLRVTVQGEGETEVFLEVGQREVVGGYEIRLEKMVGTEEKDGCALVVIRQ